MAMGNPAAAGEVAGVEAFAQRTGADFVDTIGVNTHLSWVDTPYWDFDLVTGALSFLGIQNVRDVITPWSADRVDQLGADGFDFCFVVGTFDLESQLAAFQLRVDIIDYIEGPNETDNWGVSFDGLEGMAATEAMMHHLKDWIDTDPILGDAGADIQLLQTTFGHTSVHDLDIELRGTADIANAHSYAAWGWNPSRVLGERISDAASLVSGGRVVSTEAGYHTAVNSQAWTGVSEDVQASYTLTLLLEQFKLGVEKTYIYGLLDWEEDPAHTNPEFNFGLFRTDGSPKPVAKAIHAMTDLLQTTPDLVAADLEYDVSGLPATGDHLLLQTDSDRFILAVWNDVDLWDETTNQQIDPDIVDLRVDLHGADGHVVLHDPVDGTRIEIEIGPDGTIPVRLHDNPLLVEIVLTPPAASDLHEIVGSAGADLLLGTEFRDFLVAGEGDDTVFGGAGDDVFVGGAGNDLLNGGNGIDRADYGGTTEGVEVDLDWMDGFAAGSEIGRDGLSWIEDATGGAGADVIGGNSGANRLDGRAGNDLLVGLDGDDVLIGGDGDDTLFGGGGDDVLIGGAGRDVLNGGDGNDLADFGASNLALEIDLASMLGFARDTAGERGRLQWIEDARGGSGDDRITGNEGANVLDGGAGDDWLDGAGGSNRLIGGSGADTFVFHVDRSGTTRIEDFEIRQDRICIDGKVSDATVHDAGDDLRIDMGAGTLLLVGLAGVALEEVAAHWSPLL